MTLWGRLAVVGAVLTFGFGNVIGVSTDLTGPQLGFWRFLFASIGYLVIHLMTIGPIGLAEIRIGALTGIALAVEIALFFMSIQTTTVANTTLIASMTPLVLFAVAARRFGETIPKSVIVATGLALVGVAIVVFGSSGFEGWSASGDGLAVLALATYSAYFVVGKTARRKLPGFTLQTVVLLTGTPVLLVLTVAESGRLVVPAGNQWFSVAGMIVVPTTGHLLINWSHRFVSLTYTSLVILGVPVWSVACVVLFLGREVSAAQVIGGAAVLAVLAYAVLQTARLEQASAAAEH